MATTETERRLENFPIGTLRLKTDNERLEARIEQLEQERDRLKAEIAAIKSNHPSKIET